VTLEVKVKLVLLKEAPATKVTCKFLDPSMALDVNAQIALAFKLLAADLKKDNVTLYVQ
jgi:hypothetical protein